MDANEARQHLTKSYDKKIPKLLGLLDYISNKIERAVQKGKKGVYVGTPIFGFWSPRQLLIDESLRKIVMQYYRDLGFEVSDNEHGTRFYIEWPIDMGQYRVCNRDDRLRHLIQTGMIPRVIKE